MLQTGEWIGLGLAIVIVVALVIVLVVALRATTVRWRDMQDGVKYAWKGNDGDVKRLKSAFNLAMECSKKHLKVPALSLSSIYILVWPDVMIPNPNNPRIISAPEKVWGICWGNEIWIGSSFDGLCHEICHTMLQIVGIPVTDHSKFEELGANAAISEYAQRLADV
jgi:hypothetical protein